MIRRTKIVATLGPATATPEGITRLLDAGANVIRINASHGTPELRAQWFDKVRTVADGRDQPVAILVDLQGPRIRVGELPQPRQLVPGEEIVLAPEEVARGDDLPTTYDDLATDARVGAKILLNDGLFSLEVTQVAPPRVTARVIDGGELTSHKGMNLPGLTVSAPALTPKDKEDVQAAVAWGADFLALSFVRRAEDMHTLRAMVPPSMKLVAKIEKAAALDDLERILVASDAIMVARGDLGVELPFETVPLVQKRLIRESNRHGKPVITATQMLESMVHAPRPTRAEASDVANAILDGTDAVMLSAETATGDYPEEAVAAMDRIVREMERSPVRGGEERRSSDARAGRGSVSVEDAIALGTAAVARMLATPLIVTLTQGGFTARKVAAFRPPVPILAVTPIQQTYRQLALVWGVLPVHVTRVPGYDAMLEVVRDLILKRGLAQPGDHIVMTAGVPWEVSGGTNLIKVEEV
jgi:pyruvate kinase